jgi:ribonuclease BN (tRNA processing enzyme)
LKDAKATKLVLLGTGGGPGGQGPGRTRKMTSHVMLSNGAAYVLDCGVGVIDQYARTGIPFPALRSIFITHHHADHNIEYGPLLVVGWINGMHLDVCAFGPPPLKQMTEDFMRAYKTTVDFWAEDFKMKPLVAVDVNEVSAAGPVHRIAAPHKGVHVLLDVLITGPETACQGVDHDERRLHPGDAHVLDQIPHLFGFRHIDRARQTEEAQRERTMLRLPRAKAQWHPATALGIDIGDVALPHLAGESSAPGGDRKRPFLCHK